MPSAPQPRTRVVVPLPEPEDEQDTVPEAFAARPAARKRQVRRAQAAVADPKVSLPPDERAVEEDSGLRVPIAGKYFRLSDGIGFMTLMEFAVSSDDADPESPARTRSFYYVLKDLVHPDDFAEFCKHTRDARCDATAFVAFQNAAIEALTARPTEAPAAS